MAKAKQRFKAEERVEVTWTDITGYATWIEKSETPKLDTVVCETMGYLMQCDNEHVKVAQTRESEKMGHVMVIPRGNIKKIRKLR